MKHTSRISALKIAHMIISCAIFILTYYLCYRNRYGNSVHVRGDLLLCTLYVAIYYLYSRLYDAYDIAYAPIAETVFSQTLVAFFTDFFSYFIVSLYFAWMVDLVPLLTVVLLQIVWNMLWSMIAHKIYFSLYPSKKTVVIYGGEGKEPLLRMAETYAFKKRFIISCVIENPSDFQRVLPLIKGIDCIVTSGLKESVRDDLMMYCSQNDIPAYIIPTTVDVQLRSARRIKSFSGLVLKLSRPYPSWEYFLVKRAFDILFSSFLLLLVIPLFGILALCIKLEDRGPIFYKQIRLTQNGKEFIIYKFRSMKVNAEQDGIARLSTANDDRITKTGRIIRRLRIDELPQLINVLRGDMSVVGPRPERPEIASEYEKTIPGFSLRQQVKAGLTGFAQVYGKYNTPPLEKLQMDMIYINSMSFVQDIRIMFLTVKILFLPSSTEGLKAEAGNWPTTASIYTE